MTTNPASTRPDNREMTETEILNAALLMVVERLDTLERLFRVVEPTDEDGVPSSLPRLHLDGVALVLADDGVSTVIQPGSIHIEHPTEGGCSRVDIRTTDSDAEVIVAVEQGTLTSRTSLYAGDFGSGDAPEAMVAVDNEFVGARWEKLR